MQDTYSQKVSIHIDNEVFAQEWVEIEGIEKIPGIKKAMYNKKIIYVSKTLEPELILGEHRINLKDGTNEGLQPLYHDWINQDLTETLKAYPQIDANRFFLAIVEHTKNKYKKQDLRNSLYLDIYAEIQKQQELIDFFKKSIRKFKKDVDNKMISFYKQGIMSYAAIPLVDSDQTIGYMQISIPFEKNPIIREQLQFLNAFANLTVVALIKAKEYEKGVYYNENGLHNKIFFFKRLDNYLRQGRNFSIIFTDLDHFKEYVDTFGHDMAQKVVDDYGLLMKSQLSENCLVSNYAGDEYMILIPDKTKQEAFQDAEVIRKSIETFKFDGESEELRKITVSAGVSDIHDVDNNLDLVKQKLEVIKKADDAMFYAKRNGRNNVCMWDPQVPVKRVGIVSQRNY